MKECKAGRTVLHNACQNGNITLVKLLLKQRNCDINARAYDGSTPFDLARARDRDTICVTLAAAGAKYGDDNSDSDE
jgi:ankyrin repeat protein